MKTKIAGVALAAVMGVCAFAGEAEAFSFQLDGSLDDGETGFFKSQGSEKGLGIDLYYIYYGEITTFYSLRISGELENPTYTIKGDKQSGLLQITYDVDLNSLQVSTAGEAVFPVAIPQHTGLVYTFGLKDGSIDPSGNFNSYFYGGNATISYTGFPSTVPLPASAPLFGAALLGLAGLGYAAKRKRAAAVA